MMLLIELSKQTSFIFFADFKEVLRAGWMLSSFGEWVGFYDVLRNSASEPIGLRFWPFEEVAPIFADCQSDRVSLEGSSVCFFFGNPTAWMESISGDQMMEFAGILENRERKTALLLSLSPLSVQDQASILAALRLRRQK